MIEDGTRQEGADELVVGEERLRIGRRELDTGAVRIRTTIDGQVVARAAERDVEEAVVERRPAEEHDSGRVEELEDGSLSIPVLEEELVVTRRVVVRERLIVRKERRTRTETIATELRREDVAVVRDGPEGDD